MKRLISVISVLAVTGAAIGWFLTRPDRIDPALLAGMSGDAARGEAVFWAGGCASCHAGPEAEGDARLILSGGRRFASDFGTFLAPNISSDTEAGIGGWSDLDFLNALQNGVSPEGRHYYPVFPYTAYRLATVQDLIDLRAFMATLPASPAPSLPHEVGFPFSVRRGVGVWKLLYMPDGVMPFDALSEAATRGQYLAEAMSHCGECHTPRDALGGLDRSRWLAGAPNPNGEGQIPNITPGALDWSEADIAAYLRDGFTPDFDSAGGHMADVIRNLAMLEDTDRTAIAAYLKALPEHP
ncbi:c-type cytochrome [Rhodophyticola sp. CCM32]|uniref:cytochrome c n=1 Tax=Rhodophyticola sp. CCM32 TaxID=2916397 RepID=UPI00107F2809|nr:cytochrome c [Rhodophyticola sp. CCM32]QBY00265.1 c-type cytochrome [Rhodophyticola sp. CCM32]